MHWRKISDSKLCGHDGWHITEVQLKLGRTPCCDDKTDYSGRKFYYSLTIIIINNDKRWIRGYLMGFPFPSAQDIRVQRNMVQCQHPSDFFLQSEYTVSYLWIEWQSCSCIQKQSRQGYATNSQQTIVQFVSCISLCDNRAYKGFMEGKVWVVRYN